MASSATPGDIPSEAFSTSDLQAFRTIEPVDTHAHVSKSDPRFAAFLKSLHLHLLDIVVANGEDTASFPNLEDKIAAAKAFVKSSDAHAVLCTTFDPFKFNTPSFAANAIQQLNRDFAGGAVAVKIWKNIGMQLRDQAGQFVMPDDPRLDPIYQDLAKNGKTLIAHLAEPDSCWQSPNLNSPDYSYYREHPEWYMFKHPDYPGKAAILQARDHILKKHPQLRVVGAHLGSMETNLDEIGRRFDEYPNFAVDVAARTVYLTLQPREKARQFLMRYQDRVVYGTDLGFSGQEEPITAERKWAAQYAMDWAFFSSDGLVTYRGRRVKGLALSRQVLRKLYHGNAVHWITGVVPGDASLGTKFGGSQ